MRRRTFIGTMLLTPLSGLVPGPLPGQARHTHIAVVGAGAFGGWTALQLQHLGADVTLLDAWGPGHSRSSSGGESRVIRHAYGKRLYVDMAARSLALWQAASDDWGQPLLHESGVLHMLRSERWREPFTVGRRLMSDAGIPHEMVDRDELSHRYPQLHTEDLVAAMYEPTAGYLLARHACRAVVDAFRMAGGEYRQARVQPGAIRDRMMTGVMLSGGGRLSADQYVFACGPWLKRMFPELLGSRLTISRQEMFFFGTPAGDPRFQTPAFPVWADFGEPLWYGIPGGGGRGFKVADDTRGPEHDPSTTDRTVTAEGAAASRRFLAHRFPALADAPLIESRVCQYTNTPDGDFIADRHPEADNAWLLGGGSGHGFKHGPALGEMVAAQVLGERPVEPAFSLSRFAE